MSMLDENPSVIQERLPGQKAVPLILMHDGGGTTFDYHFLNELDRDVWGIHNPRFESREPWTGGIAEMATHYIGLIRTVVPSGPIILGGWSLGGLLSLEMARQLVDDDRLKVEGIVMVDSVYPYQEAGSEKKIVTQYKPTFNSYTSEATQKAVTASFAQTFDLLKTWKLPQWNEAAGVAPPPTALIRVKNSVPVPEDAEKGAVMRVDIHREKRLLGWENYGYNFIDAIAEIPGHHYVPFKMDNVDATSSKMNAACKMIDSGSLKKAGSIDKVREF